MTESHLHFQVGDDVFVRDPSTVVPGATCIVGIIDEVDSIGAVAFYMFDAEVCKDGKVTRNRMSMPAMKLGHRVGTSLSQLDGRNGGNAEWRRISESWGY